MRIGHVYKVALSYRKLVFRQPDLVFEKYRPHQFTKSRIVISYQIAEPEMISILELYIINELIVLKHLAIYSGVTGIERAPGQKNTGQAL